MRHLFTLIATLALVACGQGQVTNSAPATPGAFDHSHTAFGALLSAHVEEGQVDYAALLASREALDGYLATVAAVTRETFGQWGESDQLAFLINAYNAFTLQLVIEHWPVESIKDTHVLNNPWGHFTFPLLGEQVTLNGIEHDLIRGNFNEPRIHFALVCAAVSCPPLQSRAFVGEDLGEQLARVTRDFLSDPAVNDLSNRDHITVSALFDWYAEDFTAASGTVQAFIAAHSGREVAAEAEVDFATYDWTINAR